MLHCGISTVTALVTDTKNLKTLIVDNDPTMLRRCITRVGGRQPLTVATSKAQAVEILKQNDGFDVIVACERLEDGSGLALLDEVQAKWPQLVRVFCTDKERLALVRNRLSAFRLRFTLTYPIVPAKLELMLVQLAHAKAASTIRIRPPVSSQA